MKPFAVEVLCPEISEALQRAAFAAGYRWRIEDRTPLHTTQPYLFIGYPGTIAPWYMGATDRHLPQWELVSIPEAFRRLREQITPPKPATRTVPVSSYIDACAKSSYAEDAAEAMGLTYDQFRRFEAEFNRRLAQHAGLTEITITAE